MRIDERRKAAYTETGSVGLFRLLIVGSRLGLIGGSYATAAGSAVQGLVDGLVTTPTTFPLHYRGFQNPSLAAGSGIVGTSKSTSMA